MSLISNVATTADNHTDAFWRTRRFASTLADARRIIEQIIHTQSTYTRRWRHIETRELRDDNSQPNGFDIIIEVPVIIFTDDLIVTVKQHEYSHVTVAVRSASRIGRYDFGENRRHIAQFLRALDRTVDNG